MRELAPYLETPLRVVVGDCEGLSWGVTEWAVRPGAKEEVVVTDIAPILDEAASAAIARACQQAESAS